MNTYCTECGLKFLVPPPKPSLCEACWNKEHEGVAALARLLLESNKENERLMQQKWNTHKANRRLEAAVNKICEAETAADQCQEDGGECYDGSAWCAEHAWMLNEAIREVRVALDKREKSSEKGN